jgi:hypothetical protein
MEKSKEESKKPPGGSGPGTPSSQMSFNLNDNIDQLNADQDQEFRKSFHSRKPFSPKHTFSRLRGRNDVLQGGEDKQV